MGGRRITWSYDVAYKWTYKNNPVGQSYRVILWRFISKISGSHHWKGGGSGEP